MSAGRLIIGSIVAIAVVGVLYDAASESATARVEEARAAEPVVEIQTEYVDRVEYVTNYSITPECQQLVNRAVSMHDAVHAMQQSEIPLMQIITDIKHATFTGSMPDLSLAERDLRNVREDLTKAYLDLGQWNFDFEDIEAACHESIGRQ